MSSEEPRERELEKKSTARDNAKEGLKKRSKRSSNSYYYWMVMIVFVLVCVACTIYLFSEWKGSPNLVQAISPENIAKHNEKKTLFQRGPNTLFQVLINLTNRILH